MTLIEAMIAMATHTATAVVAIYGIIREGTCCLVGTGTLIRHGNRLFILSAEHVLRPRPLYQYYGHSAGNGRPPQKIYELNRTEDEIIDMILVELIPESLDATGKTPVDTTIFSLYPQPPPQEHILFLHGFPGIFSEPIHVNELHSMTLPVPVAQVEDAKKIRSTSLFVDYQLTNAHDANGVARDLPDPHGLSGSSLWHPLWTPNAPEWTPSRARIVGLIKEWHEADNMLEAVQLSDLFQLLYAALAKPSR